MLSSEGRAGESAAIRLEKRLTQVAAELRAGGEAAKAGVGGAPVQDAPGVAVAGAPTGGDGEASPKTDWRLESSAFLATPRPPPPLPPFGPFSEIAVEPCGVVTRVLRAPPWLGGAAAASFEPLFTTEGAKSSPSSRLEWVISLTAEATPALSAATLLASSSSSCTFWCSARRSAKEGPLPATPRRAAGRLPQQSSFSTIQTNQQI